LVMTVLGMVAQMERRFIKERQREGIEKAKTVGVYKGGKARIDHNRVVEMRDAQSGISDIANELGCSRMQVYRILRAQEHP
ncbi:MAG: recombinase family protein, partial [Mesorhizobium sp.]|uniref:helix-turn-helix domain-containing protein n=1 Tax=Mesorhizobium sp. TaxID=1871066 RepID=UPI000FE9B88E